MRLKQKSRKSRFLRHGSRGSLQNFPNSSLTPKSSDRRAGILVTASSKDAVTMNVKVSETTMLLTQITYRRVIREFNHRCDPHFDSIRQIDRKWRNNKNENDHAALKRLQGLRQSFRSWRSTKVTLAGLRPSEPSNTATSITNNEALEVRSSSSTGFQSCRVNPSITLSHCRLVKLTQKPPSAIPDGNEAVGAKNGSHRTKITLGKQELQKL